MAEQPAGSCWDHPAAVADVAAADGDVAAVVAASSGHPEYVAAAAAAVGRAADCASADSCSATAGRPFPWPSCRSWGRPSAAAAAGHPSSACGGAAAATARPGPGASVAGCGAGDAAAFASLSVTCRAMRTAAGSCSDPGPASACGDSLGEPAGRAGARAASGSPDGCSAVAGAVGVVSTLAAAGAAGTIVGHLPYPWTLSSLDMPPEPSNTLFWLLPSSFCTRFCAPSLTRPTWRRQFWTPRRRTRSDSDP